MFQMRLLAAGLAVLWACACLLILVGYRPGGPADLLVGVATVLPLGIATTALIWPPVARGPQAFRLTVALAVGTGLILVPTIGAIYRQITGRGLQTLLPSPEAAYPWGLAILGTALFASLGVARRILGASASRPRRAAAALGSGLLVGVVTATLIASMAVANDLALGDRPAASSRFGPTDPTLTPPTCDGNLVAGATANLELQISGSVDRRSLGGARIRGQRVGTAFRWSAEVASATALGGAGAALVNGQAWAHEPGDPWAAVASGTVADEDVDGAAVRIALTPAMRASAEELGISYVEGARSRHCRAAIDGTTFRAAFPEIRWLAGDADLGRWYGELEYWVFSDGQLGEAAGWLQGEGFAISEGAIQGRLEVALTATDRGTIFSITAPRP
jgi:hypothetical protein